jgi:response regulator of citrate/malate metabolism
MEIIKILIVDDDIEWLKMASDFLNNEKDFHVIATAKTKDDAIK